MGNTTGLCECGCGRPAPIARGTDNRRGWIKGQPKRFIQGHTWGWKNEGANYTVLHVYLQKHFPKVGRCEECGGTPNRTEYALIHGREYSRNRDDYRELCVPCHRTYDGGEHHPSAKLTEAAVREIRRRHAEGETAASLARCYGIGHSAISKIVKGITWRNVLEEGAPT